VAPGVGATGGEDIRMLAARFRGNGVIEMGEEPAPRPASGEVLMRVAWCGLCGSDKRPYRDGFPLIPGHEVSGVVVDANGTGVSEGASGRGGRGPPRRSR